MKRAGITRIWQEQRSAVQHRPELVRMLYNLRRGDEVVVWKLDRLARSLSDLLQLLQRIEKAGASIRSLTEPLDTGSAIGRMFVHMLGSFAEFERSMIKERTTAGRESALARGVKFGRKRVVLVEVAQAHMTAGLTQAETARRMGCTRASICRLLREGLISYPADKP
jgi:DNA invertase Pin-like site-specific DNA recombinase